MRLVVNSSFLVGIAHAFTSHQTFKRPAFHTSLQSSLNIDDDVTRRQWLHKTAAACASTITISSNSSPSYAEDAVAQAFSNAPVGPLCDPSVSTFRNPVTNRIVHILGTAHISSASADVAGQLVREIKPSAVFVELDAKRVGKAIPKPGLKQQKGSDVVDPPSTSPGDLTETAVASNDLEESSKGREAVTSTASSPAPRSSPFNLKEKILNKASQVVGNSIKGLYTKLESEGFSAGEEFVVAVQEGLKVGSKIILGDQDVEVTLRRLTEAISKTDMKKLIAADSEMEQNMKQFMPDAAGKSLDASASNGMSREELTYFVETIKAKENVRMIMANLRSAAPEIYNAMVKERDEYMANGIDSLNQFDSIVAVMGIAHVEGVERTLISRGWEEMKPICSAQ